MIDIRNALYTLDKIDGVVCSIGCVALSRFSQSIFPDSLDSSQTPIIIFLLRCFRCADIHTYTLQRLTKVEVWILPETKNRDDLVQKYQLRWSSWRFGVKLTRFSPNSKPWDGCEFGVIDLQRRVARTSRRAPLSPHLHYTVEKRFVFISFSTIFYILLDNLIDYEDLMYSNLCMYVYKHDTPIPKAIFPSLNSDLYTDINFVTGFSYSKIDITIQSNLSPNFFSM